MNFKDEKNKASKKELDKKLNIQKFLNNNDKKKDKGKQKELKSKDFLDIKNTSTNNNLIKFINVSNTPNKNEEKIINLNNNINFINNIKSPEIKNKIELKLIPETEPKKIVINQNNIQEKKNIKEENGTLIKNISDKYFYFNSRNNEQINLQKYITSPKSDKKDYNQNINNEFNNHNYLYINNSKEKNKKEISNDNNDFIQYKNKKYKIEKIENNLDEIKKIKNDYNINIQDNNSDNKLFLNSLNERIEKIRESLNSINVIDILSEQAGLEYYKGEEFKEDEFYGKAKIINQEFYDNLESKFNQIECILNNLKAN